MAESKFAGIFQNAPAPETEQQQPSERTEKVRMPAHAARPIGRPPGKRSNPAWKQYSVLLKRETQRQASNVLREKNEGEDLSGLLQKLLEDWVKKQKS